VAAIDIEANAKAEIAGATVPDGFGDDRRIFSLLALKREQTHTNQAE
jgi:hypothetical protein